jgi:hypothetical protein
VRDAGVEREEDEEREEGWRDSRHVKSDSHATCHGSVVRGV